MIVMGRDRLSIELVTEKGVLCDQTSFSGCEKNSYAATTPKQRSEPIYRRWRSSGAYADKRLDHLGAGRYPESTSSSLERKKLAVGTVAYRVAALRFFYVQDTETPGDERGTALSACAKAYPGFPPF